MMNGLFSVTAFLGPIGGPEIILILIVGVMVIGVPLAIVLLVVALNRPKNVQGMAAGYGVGPAAVPPVLPPGGAHARLRELETLKTQGLISEEEFGEKRKRILEEV